MKFRIRPGFALFANWFDASDVVGGGSRKVRPKVKSGGHVEFSYEQLTAFSQRQLGMLEGIDSDAIEYLRHIPPTASPARPTVVSIDEARVSGGVTRHADTGESLF